MAAKQNAQLMGRVAGKRAVVIGAGSCGPGWGNGKAAAVLYAREGAKVLCVDRNDAAAKETAAVIKTEGNTAEIFVGDMTEETAAKGVIDHAVTLWGGVDILHFNIGISAKGGIAETDMASWNQVFDVNLKSAMLVGQAVLPVMKAQGSGALVFISSLAAVKAGPYAYVSYEASKAALCRLSASIAAEYAPFGVRANTILPGFIDTPHVNAYIKGDQDPDELARARARQVPMKRQGTAWDVANAALYLASDEAGFVTGVALCVDGGMSL